MSTKPSEPESEVPDLLPAPPLMNPPPAARRLSGELQRLIGAFSERAVCLREVLEVTHGRGFNLLLLRLAFPFSTPIPLPGVSTPFGLVIAFIGLRLALGQKPRLPARLLDKQLPSRFFLRFLAAEFDDAAWMKVAAADGLGFFALPTLVMQEAVASYDIQFIGRTEDCRQQFNAISAEVS